jgi:beta-1,4-mannooligosaccharide/beta-1,4-mannosyl-N-acetylglucosamine phosphorylase
MSIKVVAPALPNIPWQDRPTGSSNYIWRHNGNPIIGRRPFPGARSVYNSAVVPFDGKFIGVFRLDYEDVLPSIHIGYSDDGLKWRLEEKPLPLFSCPTTKREMEYGYDPRVAKIGDDYYIHWCNGYHGPTIGIARTRDFKTFEQFENAFLPFNRNGVLFPRKIGGLYGMLSRPSGPGHNAFGDIFYSASPDLTFWGKHRLVLERASSRWERTKIGGGPVPIETSEGWLTIYHGVMDTCNGFIYSAGAMLLDLEEPWKVIAKKSGPILWPEADYEVSGHVGNVVFPCATLVDGDTNRLAIYYGAADTHIAVAYTTVDELIEQIKKG